MAENSRIIKALEKFESKLDALDSRLDSVDKTLVKQELNLNEHMRRTEIAEQNLMHLSQKTEAEIAQIRHDSEPLKKHVAYMEGALKGIGILATIASFAAAVIKIVTIIHH